MKTFNDFLYLTEAEELQKEDAFDLIRTECTDILKAYKESKFRKFLYRGLRGSASEMTYFQDSFPINRKPKDSPLAYQNILDGLYTKLGATALRSNSLFCSGSLSLSTGYGKAFILFPRNGYYFTFSEKIEDFYDVRNTFILDIVPAVSKTKEKFLALNLEHANESMWRSIYSFLQNTIFSSELEKQTIMVNIISYDNYLHTFIKMFLKNQYYLTFTESMDLNEIVNKIITAYKSYMRNKILYGSFYAVVNNIIKTFGITSPWMITSFISLLHTFIFAINGFWEEGLFKYMQEIYEETEEALNIFQTLSGAVDVNLFQKLADVHTEESATIHDAIRSGNEILLHHPSKQCIYIYATDLNIDIMKKELS